MVGRTRRRATRPYAGVLGRNAMKQNTIVTATVGFAMMLAAGISASAAEIKEISSNALKTTLEQLAPELEKANENKIVFTWGADLPMKTEIGKTATIDHALLSTAE